MLDENSRNEIITYILKGNEMMRRHAEERQRLLKQIITLVEDGNTKNDELVNLALNEANSLKNHIDNLEMRLSDFDEEEIIKFNRLKNLNRVFAELDIQSNRRDELVQKIMQLDANLNSRDELISILTDYIDMETAQNHSLVAEIAEISDIIEENKMKLYTYDKLSKHDPRFKALEILGNNPQGMSITQLNFMLDTSRYEGSKVITELLNMNLIERIEDTELVRVTEIFESTIFQPTRVTEKLLTHI